MGSWGSLDVGRWTFDTTTGIICVALETFGIFRVPQSFVGAVVPRPIYICMSYDMSYCIYVSYV